MYVVCLGYIEGIRISCGLFSVLRTCGFFLNIN